MADAETPETAPSEPPPPSARQIACPSCDAVLRNVQTAPGELIRCLNCGKRFRLDAPANAPAQGDAAASPGTIPEHVPAKAPRGSPPASPGYWLLRIPCVLYCAFGCILLATVMYGLTQQHHMFRDEEMLGGAYLLVLCWSGVAFVLVSGALAKIDAGVLRRCWNSGSIQSALPHAQGSSLPYVGPLAVLGGVLPVLISSTTQGNRNDDVLAGGIAGGIIFYLGFACDDVRQFLFRQRQMALACCQARERNPVEANPGLLAGRGLLPLAFVMWSCFFVLMMMQSMRWRPGWGPEQNLAVMISLGVTAVAYSVYRLHRDWDEVVALWRLAANDPAPSVLRTVFDTLTPWAVAGGFAMVTLCLLIAIRISPKSVLSDYRYNQPPSTLILPVVGLASLLFIGIIVYAWRMLRYARLSARRRIVCVLPLLWAIASSFWLCHDSDSSFQYIWGVELTGLLSICAMGTFLAGWVGVFLAQVSCWRSAIVAVFAGPSAREPSLNAWGVWLPRAGFGFATLAGLMFLTVVGGLFSRSSARLHESLGFPLLLFMVTYPIIWVVLLVRDVLTVEALARPHPEAGAES